MQPFSISVLNPGSHISHKGGLDGQEFVFPAHKSGLKSLYISIIEAPSNGASYDNTANQPYPGFSSNKPSQSPSTFSKMQFSKALSLVSLFAISLAIPTVESIRARSDAPVCNDFVSSSLQCCAAPQTIGPASLLTKLPLVTSLLPIIATIPIGSLLDIPIALSCTYIFLSTVLHNWQMQNARIC